MFLHISCTSTDAAAAVVGASDMSEIVRGREHISPVAGLLKCKGAPSQDNMAEGLDPFALVPQQAPLTGNSTKDARIGRYSEQRNKLQSSQSQRKAWVPLAQSTDQVKVVDVHVVALVRLAASDYWRQLYWK